jgi:hypothetical protein
MLTKKVQLLAEPQKLRGDKTPIMTADGKHNLSDPLVRRQIANNIEAVAAVRFPADTTGRFLQRLKRHEGWLSNLRNNRVRLVESDVDAFAKLLKVTSHTLITGEGLDEITFLA